MTYEIHKDGETKEFHDEDKFRDMCKTLDKGGVEYTTTEPDVQDNPPHDNHGEPVETGTDGGTQIVDHAEGDTSPSEPDVVETPATDEIAVESQEQFVTEVKGVPEAFVVNMGTRDNKSIHIKKEGYYYLAAQMGLEYQAEPLNPTWENNSDHAAWKGIVTDDAGRTWTNVGTAHLDGEDMRGAEYNLDELAATRATCRALSMATGTGIASMEEMVDYGENQ